MRMQANRIILFISTLFLSILVLHGADDELTIITNDVGSRIDLIARTTVDTRVQCGHYLHHSGQSRPFDQSDSVQCKRKGR